MSVITNVIDKVKQLIGRLEAFMVVRFLHGLSFGTTSTAASTVVAALVLFLVSWAGPRLKKDPVEEEWKAIPDYLGTRAEAAEGRARA